MTKTITLEFLNEHGDVLAVLTNVPDTILSRGNTGEVMRFTFDVVVMCTGKIDRYRIRSETGERFEGAVRERDPELELESFAVGLETAQPSVEADLEALGVEMEDSTDNGNQAVYVKSAGVTEPIQLDHTNQNVFGTFFVDHLRVESGQHITGVFEALAVSKERQARFSTAPAQ